MDIVVLKSNLEKQRLEIQSRMEASYHDRDKKGGTDSADFEEQAHEIENDEVLNSIGNIDKNKLDEIDLALKRINEGSFGICTKCEGKIEEKRIQALPFAKNCLACARDI